MYHVPCGLLLLLLAFTFSFNFKGGFWFKFKVMVKVKERTKYRQWKMLIAVFRYAIRVRGMKNDN